MLIVNDCQLSTNAEILGFLPKRIRKLMYFINFSELEEIRLRHGLPVTLQYRDGVFFLSDKGTAILVGENPYIASKEDIAEALELISQSSIYACQEDLAKGFITIPGGNRVGISGTAISTDGKISNIKDISSLNYRIAHEVTGCSDNLMEFIMDTGRVRNTLIISPPECGKTTLLRDIIRNISNLKIKVGVVDERGEIASCHGGFQHYDLGYFTDILTEADKSQGMLMMLRSMSPQVIATDELGTDNDIDAVKKIVCSGVSVLATIHGHDEKVLRKNKNISKLIDLFECFIVLSRRFGVGTIEEVYCV